MLELNDVNAGYGSFQALFDISLEVKAGEAVAVIGPNGAGKTTLMRVISGMTAPFSGALTMEGQSLGLVKPQTTHSSVSQPFCCASASSSEEFPNSGGAPGHTLR